MFVGLEKRVCDEQILSTNCRKGWRATFFCTHRLHRLRELSCAENLHSGFLQLSHSPQSIHLFTFWPSQIVFQGLFAKVANFRTRTYLPPFFADAPAPLALIIVTDWSKLEIVPVLQLNWFLFLFFWIVWIPTLTRKTNLTDRTDRQIRPTDWPTDWSTDWSTDWPTDPTDRPNWLLSHPT